MKLSEKKTGDFTPHPETDGTVKAVIVDITPQKEVPDKFHPGATKMVFRLVYETEVKNEEGTRFCVWSRPYTPSLNEKANFRKDVKRILGRDLTSQELEEFDTEGLIGMGAKLIITHEENEGKTYATIQFIGPDKDKPIKASGKYTRVKDREEKGGSASGADGAAAGYRSAPKATADEGRQEWQKCKVHVGKHAGVDLGDLDPEAVESLIEKWLPKAKADPKPKADDRRLIAALTEVSELMGGTTQAEATEEDY